MDSEVVLEFILKWFESILFVIFGFIAIPFIFVVAIYDYAKENPNVFWPGLIVFGFLVWLAMHVSFV